MPSRLVAVVAFALAYFAQPLALDACSVSCEAARAARAATIAAPCHHTTSCASQISQPAPTGSSVVDYSLAPPVIVSVQAPVLVRMTFAVESHISITSSSPPGNRPLRV